MIELSRLSKLLELTRSDNDHEALSAIRKANTLIRSWSELFAAIPSEKPPPAERDYSHMPGGPSIHAKEQWQEIFRWLSEEVELSDNELAFVRDLYVFWQRKGYLTNRQKPWVYKLYRDKGGDKY